ncbi:hypothetical protein, variant [Blastomyces dermatitidis ATCC 18188]|uniref:Uncharacterized protein n=1 Tax=Ajellomyces dermatitidis (strain ATCC 18188 / CBS 674.68) TaxID=653446 RepID=A0A0J9HH20_AJEDA|nr:hypothetical protein BDDG_12822 [Blastomyces dermatitidis ATCC 18188]KMW68430.1 hypothetical protein, variant [Blastomyces dermatitidis ATCC 18188]
MPSRTRATAGLLDTPASNMDMNEEYEQDTPTSDADMNENNEYSGPRGEPGQMNEYTLMMRMMAYMEKQDRLMEILIQKLDEDSDSLSIWNQMNIFEQRDDLMDQLATRATATPTTTTPTTAIAPSHPPFTVRTTVRSIARITARTVMRTTARTTMRITTRATARITHSHYYYKLRPHNRRKGEG